MVAHEVKPTESAQSRPPRGHLTWMALAGMALFVVLLLMVILRPVVDRRDGPETAPPRVNPAMATAPAAAPAPADAERPAP